MISGRWHSYLNRSRNKFLYAYLPIIHGLFYKNKPVLLVNAVHKAGTHMLTDAIAEAIPLKYNERGIYNHAFSRTWPEEKRERNTTAQEVVRFLSDEAWPGEIIRGHVEYDEAIAQRLRKGDVLHVLVIRRPLDTLLSLANWWERHSEIPTIAFTTYQSIAAPEEKLRFLLSGVYNGTQIWPDLVTRLTHYLNWLDDENTLVLRYEDLLKEPERYTKLIKEHLKMSFNEKRFEKKLAHRGSRTFTRPEDKVFKSLPPEIIEAYKRLGGPELEKALGYLN